MGRQLEFKEIRSCCTQVAAGNRVVLQAIASGEQLSFQWTCSSGSIYSAGPKAIYSPPCCEERDVQVFCTVSDGKTVLKKTINLFAGKNPGKKAEKCIQNNLSTRKHST